jgi:hypothetical protein
MPSWETIAYIILLLALLPGCLFALCVPSMWKHWRRTRFLIRQIPEQEKRWHPKVESSPQKAQATPVVRPYPY